MLKPVGPDYNQSQTGWKTFPVHKELAKNNIDHWVLQAISGYHLELTQMPWHAKLMPDTKCLKGQGNLTGGQRTFLAKVVIVETIISKEGLSHKPF